MTRSKQDELQCFQKYNLKYLKSDTKYGGWLLHFKNIIAIRKVHFIKPPLVSFITLNWILLVIHCQNSMIFHDIGKYLFCPTLPKQDVFYDSRKYFYYEMPDKLSKPSTKCGRWNFKNSVAFVKFLGTFCLENIIAIIWKTFKFKNAILEIAFLNLNVLSVFVGPFDTAWSDL